MAVRSAPIVCPEESPLPASVYDNYAVRRFAAGGLVRRLWLGSGIWCPMGFSPASVPEGFQRASGKPFGAPAGAYPLPRVGYDAPTTAREWDLPSFGAPAGASPCWGLTRRLRRGSRAYSPMGRSHFSFDGERKVCKRKPAARRLQRRPTSLCTAAKPCAALGLGYALHGFQPFLALVGLRPPLVAGFGFAVPLARCPQPSVLRTL